jgi:hypothetical protein
VVAFVTSIVVLVMGTGIIVLLARRRPPGTPLTWGEAIVASVFVFGLMLVAYGIVPNNWLLLAQSEWRWRADAIALKIAFGGRGQITVTKQAIGDIIVVIIYGIMLGSHIMLWSWWQKRGRAAETPAVESSAFGRPLRRA